MRRQTWAQRVSGAACSCVFGRHARIGCPDEPRASSLLLRAQINLVGLMGLKYEPWSDDSLSQFPAWTSRLNSGVTASSLLSPGSSTASPGRQLPTHLEADQGLMVLTPTPLPVLAASQDPDGSCGSPLFRRSLEPQTGVAGMLKGASESHTWLQAPVLPLTSWVTKDRSLMYVSEPQFPPVGQHLPAMSSEEGQGNTCESLAQSRPAVGIFICESHSCHRTPLLIG